MGGEGHSAPTEWVCQKRGETATGSRGRCTRPFSRLVHAPPDTWLCATGFPDMRRTKVACCLVPVLVTQGLTGLTESATSQKIANTWLLPESTARRPHMSWSRGALVVAYLFPLALPRIAVGQATARLIADNLIASAAPSFAL